MKTMLLWLLGSLAVCLAGWRLYLLLTKDPGGKRKPPVKEPPPKEEPPPTEQQRLLEQLRQQREEIALANYRQDCAALFSGLSGGIQALLAQENLSFSEDSEFCAFLAISVENKSLKYRIASRKSMKSPEPVSPETEAADEDTLREMIRVEKTQCPDPVVALPWEKLIAELVPCLESLMRSAEEGKAEDCRAALKELRRILAAYHIYPIWYQDEVVQKDENMQWDYTFAPSYPVPALYYHADARYIRVGAPGCAGVKTGNE